jgi:hypothetical protein
MNKLDRRGFVQALLAGAANAVALPIVALKGATAPRQALAASDPSAVALESPDQRIEFTSAGRGLSFRSWVRQDGKWVAATLPQIPLVSGPSFALSPSNLERSGSGVISQGTANAEGANGTAVEYTWNARIDQPGPGNWFRFSLRLNLPQSVLLKQGSTVEPQIVIWLSAASTMMEGQSASWRRVLLDQPTQNSLGAYGNDLPSVYLLDATRGIETMLYFDLSDMGWMSLQNIPRFLAYRCSTVSRLEQDGNQTLGIGLVAGEATGNTLPAGEVRFTYWLLQRPVVELLTEQRRCRVGWKHCSRSLKRTWIGLHAPRVGAISPPAP